MKDGYSGVMRLYVRSLIPTVIFCISIHMHVHIHTNNGIPILLNLI